MSRFIPRRLMSTTFTSKPTPSKTHLHSPIPSATFPQGFVLGGFHVGVKKKPGIPDLAVILSTSDQPTTAAACFTRNAFKAAPVIVSDTVLSGSGGYARAVVVNSGCANAVTGKQGMDDAWAMVKATDALLPPAKANTNENKTRGEGFETLVMSTGVIGQNLPISKIVEGIKASSTRLGSDFSSWELAARAFMTTDTFPKLRARTFKIGGQEFRMAGMDKGAGMIHPNMGPASTQLHATLLGCIMTDAAVSPRSLQNALTYAVDRSFNSISVDGDMSTNDSIYVLANGAAARSGFVIDEKKTPEEYEVFKRELTDFAADLARLVVRDGEGATKFVTVTVKNAPSYRDAHNIASRISTSALVKTALYGEDANWGRILAATGSVPLSPSSASTPAPVIEPTTVDVTFIPSDGTAPLPVLRNGEPEKVDEVRAKEILSLEDIEIVVDLHMTPREGEEGQATYWTCDFSYEYVRINGDYRS